MDEPQTSTVTDPRDRGIIYALLALAAGVLVIIGAVIVTGAEVAQWAATVLGTALSTCLAIAATWLQVRRAATTPVEAPKAAPLADVAPRLGLSPLDPPGAANTRPIGQD